MRENDDEISSRLILVGLEISADRGLDAECAEIHPGNAVTPHAFRVGIAECRFPRADHRPSLDGTRSFAELLRREEADVVASPISRSLPREYETVWSRIGQGPQKHRIDDAEDRRGRTDRESECDHGGDGEGRRAAKLACRKAHVAQERSHDAVSGLCVITQVDDCAEGLPEHPPGAAFLLLDEVADDVIGDGGWQDALQESNAESCYHRTLMTARVRCR